MVYGNPAINLERMSSAHDVGRFLANSMYASVKNPVVHAGKLEPAHLQALVHASMLGQSQTSIVVHQWLASGVDIEDVYLEGITPVARLLGQWWCDDVIDFATATLAFTRLRQLLFELSPLFLMDACDHARGLTCFMVGEFQAQVQAFIAVAERSSFRAAASRWAIRACCRCSIARPTPSPPTSPATRP